ncbi:hypothetical protein [Devosia honganensis]
MLEDNEKTISARGEAPKSASPERMYQPLTFDPTPYLQYLAESDLSETDKLILLDELWALTVAFVDMGFNISPLQQAMDKSSENKSALASEFSDVVNSKNTKKINRKRKLRPATKMGVEG